MQAQVYNYRPDTFEFTFAGQLEFDPVRGEPMIQSFATLKEPLPSKEGFTVNFIDNEWVYLEIPREKPEQPQEPYYVWDEDSWSWVIDEEAKVKYNIASINNKAGIIITAKYPIYKQSNITLLLTPYTQADLDAMKVFIESVRTIANVAVDNGTPADQVDWAGLDTV